MKFDVWDLALLVVILLHLWYSPFTKVEESFTIQAIHDILKYGIHDIANYDHLQFPGVVPRTFIGPLIISILAQPLIWGSELLYGSDSGPSSGLRTQLLVRCVIGFTNGLSLIFLKHQAQALFDRRKEVAELKKEQELPKTPSRSYVGIFFALFSITQFHLMFYSSRPLPNFVIALPMANCAFALIMAHRFGSAIALLGFTSVVFRLEMTALTAGTALSVLLYRKATLIRVIEFGALGAMAGAAISIFVDSHFWQHSTFPEADSFLFNVVGGKSVEWGTTPFYSYVTSSLPSLFLPPTILLLNFVGLRAAPQEIKIIAQSAYFHIFILSFQPHKEWRFIIYAVPAITLVASSGASRIFQMNGFKEANLLKAVILISSVVSLIISVVFSFISSMNYPGGEALRQLNEYVSRSNVRNAVVHLDVPVCMTGATLFGQLENTQGIVYDKTEDLESLRKNWGSYDFLITTIMDPSNFPVEGNEEWELLRSTRAFSGINALQLSIVLESELRDNFPTLKQILSTHSLTPLVDAIKGAITADTVFTYKKSGSKFNT
ncbi:LAQU0S09e03356g1_1 [Lachancea quebecensis]|uniref:Mannosyltransferase n=1 Tax=Lachancea quebecensis TaxID=1654605 RepID=A0A0P1L0G4_9SACH|nr:LAQU0S09e03356g1_1 [Lachancea quebecensis]